MPDLPQIFAQPNTPYQGHIPQTTPETYGANVFATLGQVTEAMKQKQLPIEAAQLESQYNIRANDLKNKIMAENPDPLTWRDLFQAQEPGLRQEIANSASSNDAKAVFSLQAARTYDNHIIDISTAGIKMAHATQELGVKTELADLAKRYGAAQNDKERGELMQKAAGMLLSSATPSNVGGHVVPSTYTQEQITALHQEFLKTADKERVGWMAVNQPQQLVDLLKDPKQFTTLDATARHEAAGRAHEVMTQNRLAFQLAEKQRIDGVSKNILTAINAPGANLTAIREDVIKHSDQLDRTNYEHFLNVLNKGIQAQLNGEDSPFFKSQGDILGQVMKGILEMKEPGAQQWSTTDITRYIGHGLSAKDADMLSNLLDKQNKEGGGGKFSPLAQMRDSWEKQMHAGGFLNDPKQRADFLVHNPQMIAENDRRAQEVLSKVMTATAQGQDPRRALQAELQPYYDKTVTSFLDSINPFSGGFLSGTKPADPKDIAARQYLALQGKSTTDPVEIEKARKALEGARPQVPAVAPPGSTGPAFAPQIKNFYRQTFGKELPVSALGQSGTHDKMGFDHSNAMDIAINPTTKEGQAIMQYLDSQNIPFIAFDRAKPGVATGPHIHVGAPSPKQIPIVRSGSNY